MWIFKEFRTINYVSSDCETWRTWNQCPCVNYYQRYKYVEGTRKCNCFGNVSHHSFKLHCSGRRSGSVTWRCFHANTYGRIPSFRLMGSGRCGFWVTIPMSALSVVQILYFLPLKLVAGSFKWKLREVDFLCSLFSLVVTIFILVHISSGGSSFTVSSPLVVVLLVLGVVSLIIFIIIGNLQHFQLYHYVSCIIILSQYSPASHFFQQYITIQIHTFYRFIFKLYFTTYGTTFDFGIFTRGFVVQMYHLVNLNQHRICL